MNKYKERTNIFFLKADTEIKGAFVLCLHFPPPEYIYLLLANVYFLKDSIRFCWLTVDGGLF